MDLKYAFDHDLISPPVRVAIGYLIGAALLFFSYRLRPSYKAFSAVLLSGALAIMYFSSYAAYVFYDLFPQALAFTIMVLLTVYAVVEALRYDQAVIAHFGLVGAYAVPYLLGDDPDQILFLFTYVAIINIGILTIAFWRYWKTLYYAAFGITWLIYLGWFLFDYKESTQYQLALIFLVTFFVIFYLTFLAYKLIRREQYYRGDVAMLLLNSFIFYGLGYSLLGDHEVGQDRLGLFTGINALIHLGVSALVYRYKLGDRNLFYLVSGLGLIFATIAVPVQFKGNWITFLWMGELALLFWIGRTQGARPYEYLAYIIFPLAVMSLSEDWDNYQRRGEEFKSIFNINFLTSVWAVACLGFTIFINTNKKYSHPLREGSLGRQLLDYGLVLVLLMTIYFGFQLELSYYFNHLESPAGISNNYSEFRDIWVINYSLFFLALLLLVNIYKIRKDNLGGATIVLNILALLAFLFISISHFVDLQEIYQNQPNDHQISIWHIGIRYISYLFVAGLLAATYHYLQQPFSEIKRRIGFDLGLNVVILSVASLELYCWMNSLGASDSFQAGLSILWGVYALILIGLGIRWSRQYLRIAAIVLVGITLLKVAFVDLAGQNTLTKTLVLVTLGALLLVISFLYNKFREVLFAEEEEGM